MEITVIDGLSLLRDLAEAFGVDFALVRSWEEGKEILVRENVIDPSFSMEDVVILPRGAWFNIGQSNEW